MNILQYLTNCDDSDVIPLLTMASIEEEMGEHFPDASNVYYLIYEILNYDIC